MKNSDLAALAREHIEEAIEVALSILRDPAAKDADRIRVAEFLADRGYGKSAQAVIAIPANQRIAQQLFGMSNADLLEILDEGAARRALAAPIDVTAEAVQLREALLD